MKFRLFILFILMFSLQIKLQAQSARSLNREGVIHYKAGEYEKSESNYKKALKHTPTLIEASYNLGLSYYRQQKYAEALKQFKTTLAKTEDKALIGRVNHNLGNTYLQLNQLKESVEAYQNSLRISPQDEETRYNLTYALLKLKARQKNNQKDTKDLLNKIEQEENVSQQFMRRNKNMGKDVKNW
jgi:Ca-activated chloride channel homolog